MFEGNVHRKGSDLIAAMRDVWDIEPAYLVKSRRDPYAMSFAVWNAISMEV